MSATQRVWTWRLADTLGPGGANCSADSVIVARDLNSGGAKSWTCFESAAAFSAWYATVAPDDRCMYEVVVDALAAPTRLVVDIDIALWRYKPPHAVPESTAHSLSAPLMARFEAALSSCLQPLALTVAQVHWLAAHRTDKLSLHAYVDIVGVHDGVPRYFRSLGEQRRFMTDLARLVGDDPTLTVASGGQQRDAVWDLVPYRTNGCWRLPFSSKFGQHRFLLPVDTCVTTFQAAQHLCTVHGGDGGDGYHFVYEADATRARTHAAGPPPRGGRAAAVTTRSLPESDLACPPEVRACVDTRLFPALATVLPAQLVKRVVHANSAVVSYVFRIAAEHVALCPCPVRTLHAPEHVPAYHEHNTWFFVQQRRGDASGGVLWFGCYQCRPQFGLLPLLPLPADDVVADTAGLPNATSFCAETLDVARLDELVADTVFVRSGMNTQKTRTVFAWLALDAQRTRSVLFVTGRRSMAREVVRVFGADVQQYMKSTDAELSAARRCVVQLDSVPRVGDRVFDIIVLDELEFVLLHFSASTMQGRRRAVFESFVGLCARARQVVALDADLGERSVAFLVDIARRPRVGCRSFVNTRPSDPVRYIIYRSYAQWHHEIEHMLLQRSLRMYIACNSKRRARQLYHWYCKHAPARAATALLLCADTPGAVLESVQQNPNESLRAYTLCVVTPVITVGVDITADGMFDVLATYGGPGSGPVSQLYQSARRVRRPRLGENHVLLDAGFGTRELLPVSHEDIERATVLRYAGMMHVDASARRDVARSDLDDWVWRFDRQDAPYGQLYWRNVAECNRSANAFCAEFLRQLEAHVPPCNILHIMPEHEQRDVALRREDLASDRAFALHVVTAAAFRDEAERATCQRRVTDGLATPAEMYSLARSSLLQHYGLPEREHRLTVREFLHLDAAASRARFDHLVGLCVDVVAACEQDHRSSRDLLDFSVHYQPKCIAPFYVDGALAALGLAQWWLPCTQTTEFELVDALREGAPGRAWLEQHWSSLCDALGAPRHSRHTQEAAAVVEKPADLIAALSRLLYSYAGMHIVRTRRRCGRRARVTHYRLCDKRLADRLKGVRARPGTLPLKI